MNTAWPWCFQLAWDDLRENETFKRTREVLMEEHGQVPWRQTLSAHCTAQCELCNVGLVMNDARGIVQANRQHIALEATQGEEQTQCTDTQLLFLKE